MKGAVLSLNHIILNTDELQFQAWRELAMYEFGMGLPGKMAQSLAGLSRQEALQVVLQHFKQTDADEEALLKEQYEMYGKAIEGIGDDQLLPNAKRLVINFYDHYVDLAVNDTDGYAHDILEKLNLDDYFNVIVKDGQTDNLYLKACDELSIEPADCIGIGTSLHEIQLMKDANILSVGVGDSKQVGTADYQVTQVGDLRYAMLRKLWEDRQE